jgi:hypothetical protein
VCVRLYECERVKKKNGNVIFFLLSFHFHTRFGQARGARRAIRNLAARAGVPHAARTSRTMAASRPGGAPARRGSGAGKVRTRALPPAVVAPPPPLPLPLPPAPPPPLEASARQPPPLASTSAPPLQAAVSAATSLIGGNRPGAALPDDGAGIPGGPRALAATIAADFESLYFVSGAITGAAYAPDARFVDPTITVRGLGPWRTNIGALKAWLVEPSIELESAGVEVVESGGDGSDGDNHPILLRAAWRLRTGVDLPWRPAVDVRGVTTYECEAVDGGGGGEGGKNASALPRLRVRTHTEAWRTPAWAAIGQLLVPGGGGGGGAGQD